MTNEMTFDSSLTALLDDYAMNAMIALMQVYAPEEWPEEQEKADKWCDFISTRSYCMAAAMMDARHQFHGIVVVAASKEDDNA